MSVKPSSISPNQWEYRKEDILKLRRSGVSLKGKDGIITRMERVGLIASPSQYETQFKNWGERKNLNGNEWRIIIQALDQKLEKGEKYNLYLNGKLVRPSILARKRRDHCKGQEYEKRRQVGVSEVLLLDCVEIVPVKSHRTDLRMDDFDENEDVLPSRTTNRATTMVEPIPFPSTSNVFAMDEIEMGGLITTYESFQPSWERSSNLFPLPPSTSETQELGSPFFDFSSSQFPLSTGSFVQTDEQILSLLDNVPDIAGTAANQFFLPQCDDSDYLIPAWKSNSPVIGKPPTGNVSPIWPCMLPGMSPTFDILYWLAPGIPFQRFEEDMKSRGNVSLSTRPDSFPTTVNPAEGFGHRQLSTQTELVLFQSRSSAFDDALLRTEMVKPIQSSLFPLDAISPESLLGQSTVTSYQHFGSSFHRLLIYSIANNFAGLDKAPKGAVLKFLGQDTQMKSHLSEYLRATPKHVSRALVENLIRAAIENCDGPAVTLLLKKKLLEVDQIVCNHNGRRYTAVERSAQLRSFEVTEALILFGANVNKTFEERTYFKGGALELAIGMKESTDTVVDMQLINLLLNNCAEVHPNIINSAINFKDNILITTLISRFPLSRHPEAFGYNGFLQKIAMIPDSDVATTIVEKFFRACHETHLSECINFQTRFSKTLIEHAAARGYLKLVKVILSYTSVTSNALAVAVRCGRKDVIEFLLKTGADVDPQGEIQREPADISSPIDEAIRVGNSELVDYFESHGAMRQMNKGGRFSATLYAASEAGNLTYVRKILQKVTNIKEKIWTPSSLSIAIKNGYEQIAVELLDAGVKVMTLSLSGIPRCLPLLEALRKRSRKLVNMILECGWVMSCDDLESFKEAAIWGDISIIKDMLWMTAGLAPRSILTIIEAAVIAKKTVVIDYLIKEYGIQPDEPQDWESSPLIAAISNKDANMFQRLLHLGLNPLYSKVILEAVLKDRNALNKILRVYRSRYPEGKKGFGSDALQVALREKDVELIDMLLQAKLDVNAISYGSGLNALGMAITEPGGPDLDIICKLIGAGSDVNGLVFNKGQRCRHPILFPQTALLQAIRTESKALVELLVDSGADICLAAQKGLKRTPLQQACEVGSDEIVEFLLQESIDVNEAPAYRKGLTSLQACAIGGYAGIAIKLLERGADVHAAPSSLYGHSALEGAAKYGRLDMLKVIWDAARPRGFSPEQYDSAMKLAADNGHYACRDLLGELSVTAQTFFP